ncbi:IQ domain-containing protein K isoform X2 [Tenrec ecaudatus]|uniref:IQ domain-containing protein K isoform X2 n=1 Tax=Tenrec ecaudatus TaxID=94439 RepID=UPI003F59C307
MGAREESAGSPESSATTRTPAPTVSPLSPDLPVSPGHVAESPGKSLWEQICEEYEAELPVFPEKYKVKREVVMNVSPVADTIFQGMHRGNLFSVPHVSTAPPCPQVKVKTIESQTCSPRDYLETFIFPVLLPGLASLLHQAKTEKCFERKRTKFVACDFLTEWLYNHNPKRIEELFTEFYSIPFVADWLQQHPRPPIPLSLLLTEEEAALIIQSFWRGYLVRCDPEIQELRQWQKKLREDKHIRQRVKMFWAKQEQKETRRSTHQLYQETFCCLICSEVIVVPRSLAGKI